MTWNITINLFEVIAILVACLILVKPDLLQRPKWLRYLAGILLLVLGVMHLFGWSLLSTEFL